LEGTGMSIQVGFVTSVKGTDVIIQMNEDCNKVTYRFNGELYHGVAIRECVSIRTGVYNIVCMVEGEYLDQNIYYENQQEKKIYIRNVIAKPIGYIDNGRFNEGTKYLPMIKDNVFLMTDSELSSIYNTNVKTGYIIGKTLKDDIPYKADFNILFNKHIGVFGNTGSGKSNTLTKLYTDLFSNFKDFIKGKSQFILFDFNGEYTGRQILDCQDSKNIIKLNTKTKEDTISITDDCFWNEDILGLLFKATYNTQRPFLKRLVQGRNKHKDNPDSLLNYYKCSVDSFLSSTNAKREIKELFLPIVNLVYDSCNQEEKITVMEARELLEKLLWHNNAQCYYYGDTYLNNETAIQDSARKLKGISCFNGLNFVDELLVRAYLQLINGLLKGFVQFDHINPLINRINSLKQNLTNVITISSDDRVEDNNTILEVISFRKCNQDIKKILPLIIAKSYYEKHKEHSDNGIITKTLHLIIDEAHNILSYESSREEESWKDYRIDLFEEIIKEGRKFGVFMTIASQRPADISHTIMSQFHNFFIHRLVNDKDLALINNAISSLDKVSKSNIPSLPTGACIITGTSFVIPLIIQIDRIENIEHRPASDDIDLNKLWDLET
jgi:hypothetical protein